jgi:hypothetical protein
MGVEAYAGSKSAHIHLYFPRIVVKMQKEKP